MIVLPFSSLTRFLRQRRRSAIRATATRRRYKRSHRRRWSHHPLS